MLTVVHTPDPSRRVRASLAPRPSPLAPGGLRPRCPALPRAAGSSARAPPGGSRGGSGADLHRAGLVLFADQVHAARSPQCARGAARAAGRARGPGRRRVRPARGGGARWRARVAAGRAAGQPRRAARHGRRHGVAGRAGLRRAPRLRGGVLLGLRGVLQGHVPRGVSGQPARAGSAPAVPGRWEYRGGGDIVPSTLRLPGGLQA